MEKGLRWVGAAGIGVGLLFALMGLIEQDFLLLPAGVSLAVSGLLFMGFAQVIELLGEIRDALVGKKPAEAEVAAKEIDIPSGFKPRTPEEMQLAIDQARTKQDGAATQPQYSKDNFRD